MIHIGSLSIPSFQLFVFLGYALGAFLFWVLALQYTTNKWLIRLWLPVIAGIFFVSIAGSQWNNLSHLSWKNLFLFEIDSSWHKGLMTGLFGVFVFFFLVKAPLLKTLDFLALALLLGHSVGRIGCFLAGDGCYGRPTNLPWGIAFPDGAAPIIIPVHPVPLYESVILFIFFLFLFRLLKKGKKAGFIWGFYCILVGAERFMLEFLRLNKPIFFGLTEPQTIFLGFMLFGILFITGLRFYYSNSDIHILKRIPLKLLGHISRKQ